MSKILIAYATTEGQTRKIAEAVADRLGRRGHEPRLADLAEPPTGLDPAGYDAFVIAASVHIGRYQGAAERFAKKNVALLNARPSAFISVSLSAIAEEAEDEENAAACAKRFCDAAGWAPRAVHHAAGALRFSKYDFFKTWIMKRIAKDHGHDVSSREDIEFTDWDALERFVDEFARAS